jgi:hypothetical protein
MTTHAFLRRALLLPVLTPLGAVPFAFTAAVGPALQLVALFLVGSLVWGGVPYACFSVMVLRRMSRTESRRMVALAWRSPVRFAWVQGGFTALYLSGERLLVTCDPCTPWWNIGVWAVALALVGAALGYVYVALVLALHAVLRWLGAVRD